MVLIILLILITTTSTALDISSSLTFNENCRDNGQIYNPNYLSCDSCPDNQELDMSAVDGTGSKYFILNNIM